MLRQQLTTALIDFCSPLEPGGDVFQQIEQRDHAFATLTEEDLDALFAAAEHNPAGIDRLNWQGTIVDTLMTLGRQQPEMLIPSLLRQIDANGNSELALEALAGIGDHSALATLRAQIAIAVDWREEKQLLLVAALRAIGAEARADLQQLRANLSATRPLSPLLSNEFNAADVGHQRLHTRRELFEKWATLGQGDLSENLGSVLG